MQQFAGATCLRQADFGQKLKRPVHGGSMGTRNGFQQLVRAQIVRLFGESPDYLDPLLSHRNAASAQLLHRGINEFVPPMVVELAVRGHAGIVSALLHL